ncbi:MCE family protein [Gordonia neofelifaecis]|uniref:Virulence factor Mce family protein n=1 Tax=Gordonia neofelifaecis NRRL B-59395 TaxID=644548 RepID=F1YNT0_9ACTN|nr:MCE family protein [Gordonia neofelifaecis]EGD53687.1 virulence factor Mce family protein [Gordonia neofelifaecis NRRL B-59395]
MPPLNRLVRAQLIVVLLIGLVASVYGGIRYARLDQAAGIGVYRVTVKMPEGGGLFPQSQVTYRGVEIGRVDDMSMVPGGIEVELLLDSSEAQVPASAVAVVANRSAIGEQFLDLQPPSGAGPYLHDGSVIDKVELPPQLDEVVQSTIDLTETIPVDALRTTVDELGQAFNGQGENLSRLIDSLDHLSKDGVKNLDQTIALINNADPVLATQNEQSDEILRWSKGLDAVSATLASSDPAVRRILRNGPRAASALSQFLDDNGADATKLIGQLGKTADEVAPTSYAAGMTFAMLSLLSAGSHSAASPDGSLRLGIVLETGNPPSCTRGYESTWKMIAEMKRKNPAFDVSYDDFPFNTDAGCTVPTGSPTAVRGANNAQLANPAYAQPWDNNAKRDPDKLNLNPLAAQLAQLMGVRPIRG